MTEQFGYLTVDRSLVQELTIAPPPIVAIRGNDGRPLVAIHPDGRTEFGPDYEPDAAARTFWDAVRRWAPGLATGEHCVHTRAMHNLHHTTVVEGCPWCMPVPAAALRPGQQTARPVEAVQSPAGQDGPAQT
ncbi:hypothetical protein AB0D12_31880 [Streptomyces sp. NPDC048479]|uniref:hypothetical protein n=1 Tax=Streptomyces sp. NPDC048479 TaxID=3154725 RepID=UPI0034343362